MKCYRCDNCGAVESGLKPGGTVTVWVLVDEDGKTIPGDADLCDECAIDFARDLGLAPTTGGDDA